MNKKNFTLLTLIFLLSTSLCTHAQITSSTNFIKGGENDAIKIISAYLMPIERALCFNGANNNMQIFNTNSEIQIGIGLNLTASFINSKDFTYDVNDLNLEAFEAANPNNTIAQTFAGNDNTIVLQTQDKYKVPTTTYPFYSEKPILSLNSPDGKSQTSIPFPLIHLFAEKQGNLVELKLLPPFLIDNSTVGLFNIGINIQHNLKTSLEFMSDFWADVYISGGFNYNRIIYYLDIKPNEQALTFSTQSDNGPYDDQKLHIRAKSLPIKISFVKTYNNFSFFASTAYNAMFSLVKMTGKYPVYTTDPSNQFQIISTDIADPFEYTQTFNKFSLDIGVNYQKNRIISGLKYTHSYYKNINLSFAFILN